MLTICSLKKIAAPDHDDLLDLTSKMFDHVRINGIGDPQFQKIGTSFKSHLKRVLGGSSKQAPPSQTRSALPDSDAKACRDGVAPLPARAAAARFELFLLRPVAAAGRFDRRGWRPC